MLQNTKREPAHPYAMCLDDIGTTGNYWIFLSLIYLMSNDILILNFLKKKDHSVGA